MAMAIASGVYGFFFNVKFCVSRSTLERPACIRSQTMAVFGQELMILNNFTRLCEERSKTPTVKYN